MVLLGPVLLQFLNVRISKKFSTFHMDYQMIKRNGRFTIFYLLFLPLLVLLPLPTFSSASDIYLDDQSVIIQRVNEIWKGDLQAAFKQRRSVRVLVSYSNTNFFINQGRPRGIEYELLKRYEKFLNQNHKKKAPQIKLIYWVLPFDQLIPALLEGRGDIIAAGMTITPQRQEKVAFTQPYIKNINEIAVASKNVQGLKTARGLSDRKIHVVAGSSYVGHLKRLNTMLSMEGFGPAQIIEANKNLEAEDILQMINCGIYDLTVVDQHRTS
jgi:membrane-bound lytic murein transglycosylase MltF